METETAVKEGQLIHILENILLYVLFFDSSTSKFDTHFMNICSIYDSKISKSIYDDPYFWTRVLLVMRYKRSERVESLVHSAQKSCSSSGQETNDDSIPIWLSQLFNNSDNACIAMEMLDINTDLVKMNISSRQLARESIYRFKNYENHSIGRMQVTHIDWDPMMVSTVLKCWRTINGRLNVICIGSRKSTENDDLMEIESDGDKINSSIDSEEGLYLLSMILEEDIWNTCETIHTTDDYSPESSPPSTSPVFSHTDHNQHRKKKTDDSNYSFAFRGGEYTFGGSYSDEKLFSYDKDLAEIMYGKPGSVFVSDKREYKCDIVKILYKSKDISRENVFCGDGFVVITLHTNGSTKSDFFDCNLKDCTVSRSSTPCFSISIGGIFSVSVCRTDQVQTGTNRKVYQVRFIDTYKTGSVIFYYVSQTLCKQQDGSIIDPKGGDSMLNSENYPYYGYSLQFEIIDAFQLDESIPENCYVVIHGNHHELAWISKTNSLCFQESSDECASVLTVDSCSGSDKTPHKINISDYLHRYIQEYGASVRVSSDRSGVWIWSKCDGEIRYLYKNAEDERSKKIDSKSQHVLRIYLSLVNPNDGFFLRVVKDKQAIMYSSRVIWFIWIHDICKVPSIKTKRYDLNIPFSPQCWSEGYVEKEFSVDESDPRHVFVANDQNNGYHIMF